MHRIIPLAAVHQHKVHVGIVFHLLAYERLEGNTPVGVIRDEGDVLGFGKKRTNQLDIAADVILVEHTAHIVAAFRRYVGAAEVVDDVLKLQVRTSALRTALRIEQVRVVALRAEVLLEQEAVNAQ